MTFNGLSLDQAPPFEAPLRFFLTAPLFGLLAGMVLLFSDASAVTLRYAPETIAVTHLMTLGFFAMVMLGALQQMLPVLAGVSLKHPLSVARWSHIALTLGTLLMSAGLYSGYRPMLWAALPLLAIAFIWLLGAIGHAMAKVSFITPTVRAMMIAAVLGAFTIVLGLHLLGAHATEGFGSWHVALGEIHAVLGIFGFTAVLIIGVAFQVLPMFYVAEAYGQRLSSWLTYGAAFMLAAWSVVKMAIPDLENGVIAGFAVFFGWFAVTVVLRLYRRRRPVVDATIGYWYSGAGLLLGGLLFWLADAPALLCGIWIGGFVMAVMTGMLYKIVPFLAWFHLNASGYMTIPTMREMIDARRCTIQLGLFWIAVVLLSAAALEYLALWLGGIVLAASMLLLEHNLLEAVRTYYRIRQQPPEFSFEAMPEA